MSSAMRKTLRCCEYQDEKIVGEKAAHSSQNILEKLDRLVYTRIRFACGIVRFLFDSVSKTVTDTPLLILLAGCLRS